MCQFGDAIHHAATLTGAESVFGYDENGLFSMLSIGTQWVIISSNSPCWQSQIRQWVDAY